MTPPGCTNPGPGRLAQKMSVMSVETSPPSAHRTIAAERVHRPGSRRLGGVKATGASPGVAPSRPHRSGPRAGPGRRTPCARGAWGGEPAGGWVSDMPNSLKCRRGPGLWARIRWRGRAYRRTFAGRYEENDGPPYRNILHRGHHRFSTAFRSRACFVRRSRGVREMKQRPM